MRQPALLSSAAIRLGRIAALMVAVTSLSCDHEGPTETTALNAAAQLVAIAGDSQQGEPATALDSALVVEAIDSAGEPVAGVPLVTRVIGGGSVTPAEAVTDRQGQARFIWTLGPSVADSQVVTVATDTGAPTARFTARLVAGAPTEIRKISGDDQQAPANTVVLEPLVIQVVDAYGNPVPHVTVTFRADGAEGLVSPSTAITDSAGRASTRRTTGPTLGPQTTTVQVAGAPDVVFVTTVADRDGAARTIAVYSGDHQTATVGFAPASPYAVIVRDAAGYPVPGVEVRWMVGVGGGSVFPDRSKTNADGIATTLRAFGTKAGTQSTIASVSGLVDSVIFVGTATPDVAATLAKYSGDGQSGVVGTELAQPLAVVAKDKYGNPVPGVSVQWATTSGTVSASGALTDSTGVARVTRTLGTTSGVQTVTASVNGLTGSPVVFTATATADVPAALTVVAGDKQRGLPETPLGGTPTVLVADQYNNPIAGAIVHWTVLQGGGRPAMDSSSTNAQGLAQTVWTLGAAGSQRLEAQLSTLAWASADFTATAVAPMLSLRSGDGQTGIVDTPLPNPLTVRVVGTDSLPFEGVTVTWFAGEGGASVATPMSVTDAQGIASATGRLGPTVGRHTIGAVFGTDTVWFTAVATGPLGESRQEIAGGNNQFGTAGRPLNAPLEVRVLNLAGAPVSGVPVRWTVGTGSAGQLSTDVSMTDAAGIARVQATLPAGVPVGTQERFVARVAALPDSAVFLATVFAVDTAAAIEIVDGDEQVGRVGQVLGRPFRVRVTSSSGQPVAGTHVFWTIKDGGGSFASTSSVTDADGMASATRILGPVPGAQTAEATVPGLAMPTVVFHSTAVAPTYLEKTASSSGDNQTGVAGQLLASPLRVVVLDANRAPVPEVTVQWTVLSGGGLVNNMTSSTSATDASGVATMSWTLGASTDVQTVQATVAGLPAVTFNAMATSTNVPAFVEPYIGNNQRGIRGEPLLGGLTVRVLDAVRSPVAGIPVSWEVTAGSGRVSTASVVTDADGYASVEYVLGNEIGLVHAVRASVRTADGGVVSTDFTLRATDIPAAMVLDPVTDNQTAGAGFYFPSPLKVTVTDAAGEPVCGARVTWAITAGGGELSATGEDGSDGTLVTVTDEHGVALVFRKAGMVPTDAGTSASLLEYPAVPSVFFKGTITP